MVRLLPSRFVKQKSLNRAFQSHNGAIAAFEVEGLETLFVWFQSHNGAIAAGDVSCQQKTRCWFQSHNGAIAATF